MTPLSRRSLITGLISLVAAPAIVRASSLMPAKSSLLLVQPETELVAVQEVFFQGYRWWITGKDNVIHYEKVQDQFVWI